MSIYKRQEIPELIKKLDQGESSPVYLIWGERYLCQNAAQELTNKLLPEQEKRDTGLVSIDGDQEDFKKTLSLLKTYSLFSGLQVIWVRDSRLFHSRGVAKNIWEKARERNERNEGRKAQACLLEFLNLTGVSLEDLAEENLQAIPAARWKKNFGFAKPKEDLSWADALLAEVPPDSEPAKGDDDPAGMFQQALEQGIPKGNTLILQTETIDKRKKFYKYIQKHGVVLDLSVESGSSQAAKRDQEKVVRELITNTLEQFGKKINNVTLSVLLERIGFHPVAAVMEAEKLALSVADRKTISREDIDAIIGRTREEALFELTESVTAGKLEDGLQILGNLQNNGVHGLQIIATLKNHLKKLLLARALQDLDTPAYTRPVAKKFNIFKDDYLPTLKEGRDEWTNILWKSHPYALFMLFSQASNFTCGTLQVSLKEILAAEYRMKSSSVDTRLIMDNLLFNLIRHEHVGAGVK